MDTAADWLISIGPKLEEFRAQDRTEFLSLMRTYEKADAELMRRLAWNRYLFPECREFWRRAFVGLSLDEAWGGGTMDMGPDEKRWEREHPGCGTAWSID